MDAKEAKELGFADEVTSPLSWRRTSRCNFFRSSSRSLSRSNRHRAGRPASCAGGEVVHRPDLHRRSIPLRVSRPAAAASRAPVEPDPSRRPARRAPRVTHQSRRSSRASRSTRRTCSRSPTSARSRARLSVSVATCAPARRSIRSARSCWTCSAEAAGAAAAPMSRNASARCGVGQDHRQDQRAAEVINQQKEFSKWLIARTTSASGMSEDTPPGGLTTPSRFWLTPRSRRRKRRSGLKRREDGDRLASSSMSASGCSRREAERQMRRRGAQGTGGQGEGGRAAFQAQPLPSAPPKSPRSFTASRITRRTSPSIRLSSFCRRRTVSARAATPTLPTRRPSSPVRR